VARMTLVDMRNLLVCPNHLELELEQELEVRHQAWCTMGIAEPQTAMATCTAAVTLPKMLSKDNSALKFYLD